MRKKFCIIALLFAGLSVADAAVKPELVYRNADDFPVFGKCIEATSARYERLPASYEQISRGPVWYLGRNSAGLYVRFRSDSPVIGVRWESTFKNHMNHQTLVGTRGLDLYALEKDGWRFVNSARPDPKEKVTSVTVISGMEPQMREYMLYLSLYDGVKSLEIGVEEGSVIAQPAISRPESSRPIVMYGTSILQGGCANRPGMAHTNILARLFDREVINLGFSGNALLDMEIAELMARVENPAVFVLDYVPNASAAKIDESGEQFFRILRDAHPQVPVIFVEDPTFPHTYYDARIREEVRKKNEAQRRLFDALKKQGEKKIFYVGTENMIGEDAEATVDGVHFTDLGMMRYAGHIAPVIRKALKAAGIRRQGAW